MQELLKGLISSIFKGGRVQPSPLLIESVLKHTRISSSAVDETDLERLVKARSYNAYLMYRRMFKTDADKIMFYIIVRMSNSQSSIADELNRNLKKGALGFETSYFTDHGIGYIRDKIDLHTCTIVFQVYQNACIYKKLKCLQSFHSKAHSQFYRVVREELEIYECAVMAQEDELLEFYSGMYSAYIKLQIIHQLNECFADYPKMPFEFLKPDLYSGRTFYRKVLESSFLHINRCLNSFVSRGEFSDDTNEFFICKNVSTNPWDEFTVDFGLVPRFVCNKVIEKILYIGKCALLVRKYNPGGVDGTHVLEIDGYAESKGKCILGVEDAYEDWRRHACLDILSHNLADDVDLALAIANKQVEERFLKDMRIWKHIDGARNSFLFGRGDFIETLFMYLKDSRNLSSKSFSYVLDMAVRNTYGQVDEFASSLGVYIVDEKNRYENFALFSHVEYPANMVITNECILKLVMVFQFLWKLKLVEHLVLKFSGMELEKPTRIRIALYTSLVYKISYFVFEEVISLRWRFSLAGGEMPLNDLRKGVERSLDAIICQSQIGGGMEKALDALRDCLMDAGTRMSVFDDAKIQKVLFEMVEKSGSMLIGTSLSDLRKYVIV
ncbi:putative gamma-tubulin complex protein [Ordospora pajunii]|uniref:putative gamma-tubulin complex protein n=1 Tax=Ordospora pajunii TaxID=3039483 RepID=UPI00295288DD|nr:putative gamma-tubulin complex protein [Ordospora pajunii]KAH9411371.1 putative gamma-tubulin complex protein [Ordospora pajunii]